MKIHQNKTTISIISAFYVCLFLIGLTISSYSSKINSITYQYQILEDDYNELDYDYYVLSNNHNKLKDDYNDLKSEINNYKDQQATIDDLNAKLTELQGQYDSLQSDRDNLQAQVDAKKAEQERIAQEQAAQQAQQQRANAGGGTVYWVAGGSVYHSTPNCPTLKRSSNIQSGSISQSGKSRACKVCN